MASALSLVGRPEGGMSLEMNAEATDRPSPPKTPDILHVPHTPVPAVFSSMSWVEVDFNLVKYSPIEGAHYFYDPAYPTAIQFLVNGRWEPWSVSYVKRNAKDPEIKRIAEEAEGQSATNAAGDSRIALLPSPSNDEHSAATYGNLNYGHLHGPGHLFPHSPGLVHSSHFPQQPYVSPYSVVTPSMEQSTQERPDAPNLDDSKDRHHFAPTQSAFDFDDELPLSSLTRANRETKILLSLDGDGIRGLSTVLLIESLVNAVCGRLGVRADPFQIFDLMGGTSTGGLIAIMLGRLRMRPHRAREAYTKLARTMFRDKRQFFMSFDPNAPQPPYDDTHETNLREIISQESETQQDSGPDDAFIDSRVHATHVFVVSTQVDIGVNRPAIIRTYPTRRMAGPEIDPNLTILQAMKATSAAPRYMAPADGAVRRTVIEPGLVDYGTAKNNPVQDLVYECRKLYSYANDLQIVVSIGTGIGFNRFRESQEMANGIESRLSEAQSAGDRFEGESRSLLTSGWMKYFRFNVPDLYDVPLDEWDQTERIMEKTHAYLGIPEVGQRFYACVDAIVTILSGEQRAAAA